ncbi:protein-glutamine glutaminase family protein [Amycolatopsis thailandensis]|uniref:protein-glutamine glutaminase family protein n=1 Tax=Amycolatopsis thailandensis TaxID=589330 RepID=UPI003625158A
MAKFVRSGAVAARAGLRETVPGAAVPRHLVMAGQGLYTAGQMVAVLVTTPLVNKATGGEEAFWGGFLGAMGAMGGGRAGGGDGGVLQERVKELERFRIDPSRIAQIQEEIEKKNSAEDLAGEKSFDENRNANEEKKPGGKDASKGEDLGREVWERDPVPAYSVAAGEGERSIGSRGSPGEQPGVLAIPVATTSGRKPLGTVFGSGDDLALSAPSVSVVDSGSVLAQGRLSSVEPVDTALVEAEPVFPSVVSPVQAVDIGRVQVAGGLESAGGEVLPAVSTHGDSLRLVPEYGVEGVPVVDVSVGERRGIPESGAKTASIGSLAASPVGDRMGQAASSRSAQVEPSLSGTPPPTLVSTDPKTIGTDRPPGVVGGQGVNSEGKGPEVSAAAPVTRSAVARIGDSVGNSSLTSGDEGLEMVPGYVPAPADGVGVAPDGSMLDAGGRSTGVLSSEVEQLLPGWVTDQWVQARDLLQKSKLPAAFVESLAARAQQLLSDHYQHQTVLWSVAGDQRVLAERDNVLRTIVTAQRVRDHLSGLPSAVAEERLVDLARSLAAAAGAPRVSGARGARDDLPATEAGPSTAAAPAEAAVAGPPQSVDGLTVSAGDVAGEVLTKEQLQTEAMHWRRIPGDGPQTFWQRLERLHQERKLPPDITLVRSENNTLPPQVMSLGRQHVSSLLDELKSQSLPPPSAATLVGKLGKEFANVTAVRSWSTEWSRQQEMAGDRLLSSNEELQTTAVEWRANPDEGAQDVHGRLLELPSQGRLHAEIALEWSGSRMPPKNKDLTFSDLGQPMIRSGMPGGFQEAAVAEDAFVQAYASTYRADELEQYSIEDTGETDYLGGSTFLAEALNQDSTPRQSEIYAYVAPEPNSEIGFDQVSAKAEAEQWVISAAAQVMGRFALLPVESVKLFVDRATAIASRFHKSPFFLDRADLSPAVLARLRVTDAVKQVVAGYLQEGGSEHGAAEFAERLSHLLGTRRSSRANGFGLAGGAGKAPPPHRIGESSHGTQSAVPGAAQRGTGAGGGKFVEAGARGLQWKGSLTSRADPKLTSNSEQSLLEWANRYLTSLGDRDVNNDHLAIVRKINRRPLNKSDLPAFVRNKETDLVSDFESRLREVIEPKVMPSMSALVEFSAHDSGVSLYLLKRTPLSEADLENAVVRWLPGEGGGSAKNVSERIRELRNLDRLPLKYRLPASGKNTIAVISLFKRFFLYNQEKFVRNNRGAYPGQRQILDLVGPDVSVPTVNRWRREFAALRGSQPVQMAQEEVAVQVDFGQNGLSEVVHTLAGTVSLMQSPGGESRLEVGEESSLAQDETVTETKESAPNWPDIALWVYVQRWAVQLQDPTDVNFSELLDILRFAGAWRDSSSFAARFRQSYDQSPHEAILEAERRGRLSEAEARRLREILLGGKTAFLSDGQRMPEAPKVWTDVVDRPEEQPQIVSYANSIKAYLERGLVDDALTLVAHLDRDLRALWAVQDSFTSMKEAEGFPGFDLLEILKAIRPEEEIYLDHIFAGPPRKLESWQGDAVPTIAEWGTALNWMRALKAMRLDLSHAKVVVPHEHLGGGAAQRAHLGVLKLTQLGAYPRKIFAVASGGRLSVEVEGPFGESEQMTWSSHEAPVAYVRGPAGPDWMVFDPSLADRPLSQTAWLSVMHLEITGRPSMTSLPSAVAAVRHLLTTSQNWGPDGLVRAPYSLITDSHAGSAVMIDGANQVDSLKTFDELSRASESELILHSMTVADRRLMISISHRVSALVERDRMAGSVPDENEIYDLVAPELGPESGVHWIFGVYPGFADRLRALMPNRFAEIGRDLSTGPPVPIPEIPFGRAEAEAWVVQESNSVEKRFGKRSATSVERSLNEATEIVSRFHRPLLFVDLQSLSGTALAQKTISDAVKHVVSGYLLSGGSKGDAARIARDLANVLGTRRVDVPALGGGVRKGGPSTGGGESSRDAPAEREGLARGLVRWMGRGWVAVPRAKAVMGAAGQGPAVRISDLSFADEGSPSVRFHRRGEGWDVHVVPSELHPDGAVFPGLYQHAAPTENPRLGLEHEIELGSRREPTVGKGEPEIRDLDRLRSGGTERPGPIASAARIRAGAVLGDIGSVVGEAARHLQPEPGVFGVVVARQELPAAGEILETLRNEGWNGQDRIRLFVCAQPGLAEVAQDVADATGVVVSHPAGTLWLGAPESDPEAPAARVGTVENTPGGVPMVRLFEGGRGWSDLTPRTGQGDGVVTEGSYVLAAPVEAPRLGLAEMHHLGPADEGVPDLSGLRLDAVHDLPVTAGSAGGISFDSGAASEANYWERLHEALPTTFGPKSFYVYAVAEGDGFLVGGEVVDPATLAESVKSSEALQAADSASAAPTPVIVIGAGHVKMAEDFAKNLQNLGPYRLVQAASARLVVDDGGQAVIANGGKLGVVSRPRPEDVLWKRMTNLDSMIQGVALVSNESDTNDFRVASSTINDHPLRVVVETATTEFGPEDAVWPAPWASATMGARVRPFILQLEAKDGRIHVPLDDGSMETHPPRFLAQLVARSKWFKEIASASVRPPLVLLVRDPGVSGTERGVLTSTFLAELRSLTGAWPSFDYQGPFDFGFKRKDTSNAMMAPRVPEGAKFTESGGPLTMQLSHVATRSVFGFPGRRRDREVLESLAEAIEAGEELPGPWAGEKPLLVIADSSGGEAAKLRWRSGEVTEADGAQLGRVLAGDEGFLAGVKSSPDRPVVLLASDGGRRTDPGALGFDFAGALRAEGLFNPVYSPVGRVTIAPGPASTVEGLRFKLVSAVRTGDVEVDSLLGRDGSTTALFIRYPGDSLQFERARAWALEATPKSLLTYFDYVNEDQRVRIPASWSRRSKKPPLFILGGMSEEGYQAIRKDGKSQALSMAELGRVVRNERDLRAALHPDRVAGRGRPFVLAAMNDLAGFERDRSADLDEFAGSFLRGGYTRWSYSPRGRLRLFENGTVGVHDGAFQELAPLQAGPENVVSTLLRNEALGEYGQVFPLTETDAQTSRVPGMSVTALRQQYYLSALKVTDPEGNEVSQNVPFVSPWWGDPWRTWEFEGHSEVGRQSFGLRTDIPGFIGDTQVVDPERGAEIIFAHHVFRRATADSAISPVMVYCSHNAFIPNHGNTNTFYFQMAARRIYGQPVPAYGGTDLVSRQPTSLRRVHNGGNFTQASPPGGSTARLFPMADLAPGQFEDAVIELSATADLADDAAGGPGATIRELAIRVARAGAWRRANLVDPENMPSISVKGVDAYRRNEVAAALAAELALEMRWLTERGLDISVEEITVESLAGEGGLGEHAVEISVQMPELDLGESALERVRTDDSEDAVSALDQAFAALPISLSYFDADGLVSLGGFLPVADGATRVRMGVVLGDGKSDVGKAFRWIEHEPDVFGIGVTTHQVPDWDEVHYALRAGGWNRTDAIRLFVCAQEGLSTLSENLRETWGVRVSRADNLIILGEPGEGAAARVVEILYGADGGPKPRVRRDGGGWIDDLPPSDLYPDGASAPGSYTTPAPAQRPQLGLRKPVRLGLRHHLEDVNHPILAGENLGSPATRAGFDGGGRPMVPLPSGHPLGNQDSAWTELPR